MTSIHRFSSKQNCAGQAARGMSGSVSAQRVSAKQCEMQHRIDNTRQRQPTRSALLF